jgi:hypothetical protein
MSLIDAISGRTLIHCIYHIRFIFSTTGTYLLILLARVVCWPRFMALLYQHQFLNPSQHSMFDPLSCIYTSVPISTYLLILLLSFAGVKIAHTHYVLGGIASMLSFLLKLLWFPILPSVLEIVGLRVPARYIRDLALFNVCSSCKNCPSAGCASAANVVCRDIDVFGARNLLLNRFL